MADDQATRHQIGTGACEDCASEGTLYAHPEESRAVCEACLPTPDKEIDMDLTAPAKRFELLCDKIAVHLPYADVVALRSALNEEMEVSLGKSRKTVGNLLRSEEVAAERVLLWWERNLTAAPSLRPEAVLISRRSFLVVWAVAQKYLEARAEALGEPSTGDAVACGGTDEGCN